MNTSDETKPTTCLACGHCFMEPDSDFLCGHPDAGDWGVTIRRATASDGHCGPVRPKFEQHPDRTATGLLKR